MLNRLLNATVKRKHSGDGYYLFNHQEAYGATTLEFYSMIDIETETIQCLYFPVYNALNRSDESIKKLIETANYYQFQKLYEQFTIRVSKRLDTIKEVKLWLKPNATYEQVINLSYKVNVGYHKANNEIDYDLLYEDDFIGDYLDDNAWYN